MQPLKLVVSGAVGSGKTTLIQTLSETDVIETDVKSSEDIGKDNTTIAFDFGTVHIGEDLLFLFGTPGQERFDFMWDVLCEGALGLLLLVSGIKPSDFRHSRHILEFITSRFSIPYVVGVTHQDYPTAWRPEDVAAYFDVPLDRMIGLNATELASCKEALCSLLAVVDQTPDAELGYEADLPQSSFHPLSTEAS